jgi:Family of unknown function (DUF6188)
MIDLIERDAGLEVRFADGEVAFVTIAAQFKIGLRDSDGDYLAVTLSTPFGFRDDSGGEWSTLDPEADDERLGVLAVRLRRARATACRIAADGTLNIAFDRNLGICIRPDDQYESWDLEQERFKVVGGRGGELFVWRRSELGR